MPKWLLARVDGQPTRVEYGEIDHCCANFVLVDGWLNAQGLQRTGPVGAATARLARSRAIVAVVTAQIAQNETVFLHSSGLGEPCEECDAARASLPA